MPGARRDPFVQRSPRGVGDRLYGLPLPSPRFGVATVMAIPGTGRLQEMAATFRGPMSPHMLEIDEFDEYVALAAVDEPDLGQEPE